MKVQRIILCMVILCLISFCSTESVFARSMSLTTVITITVKAEPQINLSETDKNTDMLKTMAENQSVISPYEAQTISEGINLSGNKVYSIASTL